MDPEHHQEDPIRVCICRCTYKKPHPEHTHSFDEMLEHTRNERPEIDISFSLIDNDSMVTRARQIALGMAINDGVDYDFLFTVDDDLILPPDALIKLIDADRDIVAGLYRLKCDDEVILAHVMLDGEEKLIPNDVIPIKYAATGCTLVKWEVVKRMTESFPELRYHTRSQGKKIPMWGFYIPVIHEDRFLSEDCAFCLRAKELGFEVWAHGGVRCGHVEYDFLFSDSKTHWI